MNKKQILALSAFFMLSTNSIKTELLAIEDQLINEFTEQLRRKEADQKTQAILARFATIVMSFFGILQNPRDKQNLVENVTGMLTGAVQMVAEAVKTGVLSLDATDEEIRAYATEVTRMMEPELKILSLELEAE